MVRYPTTVDGDAPPSETWLFAQALLGKPIPDPAAKAKQARAERERLEWLAQISTEHEAQLRKLQSAEAEARHQRELLEWLAQISTEHEAKLRRLKVEEYEAQEAQQRWEQCYQDYSATITEWNEVDHPRRGYGPHPGAWVGKGGSGGSSTGQSPTFLDAVIRRNQAIADLTGVVTPGMLRSTRLATEIQSAARLAADVTAAAAAGLGTGVKANVNGFATAVKDAATLGLNPGQLELIGVTKEDRDRGYDTAAAISTASGQILLAVGTGAISSALSKGGTIARTANKALVVYDTAGNAVGVVQGVYDASQNKLSIANGAQIAGGLLGLGANFKATRNLTASSPLPKGFDPAKGFASFQDFKDAFGVAGPGQAWHHVVEQTINSGKFAPEILHNPANLFRLPHGKGSIHAKVSGYYSSRPRFTGGLTVREWLSKKSFKEQFEFGIQKIKEFGGSEYLPPHLR